MDRIREGARVAVIGAGPGGLTAAKHALEAGYDVSVFEASDDLGGQWNTAAPASGIWPGMRTNTSRAMTAFSDHPVPAAFDLYPRAEQIHSYLPSYADAFGVTGHIRFGTVVRSLRPAWEVDGEPFDAVVVASGGSVHRSCLRDWTGSADISCTPSTTRARSSSPAAGSWSTATGSAVTGSPPTSPR